MTMLIAAAAVPAVLLLVYVYKIDRLEHEPPGLIIGLVLLTTDRKSVVRERV